MSNADRLKQQLAFIIEMDKLKTIIRRSYLINTDRFENDAEHSWHLAIMAMVLAEHANQAVDLPKVLKMVLVHDIIEIDAGDTYAYDPAGHQDQVEREQQAAERLFNLLPPDQAVEFRALWDEFEARATAEARFAKGLDRLMPLLHNYHTQGKAWRENNISRQQVLDFNGYMNDGSERLWEFARELIDQATNKGYLTP